MALATRCPACDTVFRISTAQAAAKGGMVRCGQCRNVFNSLDALVRVEDLDIVDESTVTMPSSAILPAASSPLPALPAEEAPAGDVDDLDVPTGFPHSEISSVLASLSSDTKHEALINEWWMPDPADRASSGPNAGPPSMSGRIEPVLADDDTVAPIGRASERGPDTPPVTAVPTSVPAAAPATLRESLPWAPDDSATGPVFMQPPAPVRAPHRAARWTSATLSLVAAIVLCGQLAYLWRDEIAVRWAPARPWLIAACRAIGCRVDHPARLDAITIESATVQATASGSNVYVLNALLRNRDTVDVRYPSLDLILTDTDDRVVLRRVLRPEDYVSVARDGSGLASPGFAAQSELPVRVTFDLDDLRFAGYRLDRFYP